LHFECGSFFSFVFVLDLDWFHLPQQVIATECFASWFKFFDSLVLAPERMVNFPADYFAVSSISHFDSLWLVRCSRSVLSGAGIHLHATDFSDSISLLSLSVLIQFAFSCPRVLAEVLESRVP
jgi:hypothetical protein